MFLIIFTQGNNETIVAEYGTLEGAKIAAKEYKKRPEYSNGLITVETWKDKNGKGKRIY